MAEQDVEGKINSIYSKDLEEVLANLTGNTALQRERGVLALNRLLNGAIVAPTGTRHPKAVGCIIHV